MLRKFQEVTLLVVTLLVVKSCFSGNYSKSGSNTIICLREENAGASLNGEDPSQLHVVELKRWLRCRGATIAAGSHEEVS